jgi:hypothetical protein
MEPLIDRQMVRADLRGLSVIWSVLAWDKLHSRKRLGACDGNQMHRNFLYWCSIVPPGFFAKVLYLSMSNIDDRVSKSARKMILEVNYESGRKPRTRTTILVIVHSSKFPIKEACHNFLLWLQATRGFKIRPSSKFDLFSPKWHVFWSKNWHFS